MINICQATYLIFLESSTLRVKVRDKYIICKTVPIYMYDNTGNTYTKRQNNWKTLPIYIWQFWEHLHQESKWNWYMENSTNIYVYISILGTPTVRVERNSYLQKMWVYQCKCFQYLYANHIWEHCAWNIVLNIY